MPNKTRKSPTDRSASAKATPGEPALCPAESNLQCGRPAAQLQCNLRKIAALPDLGAGDAHKDLGEVQNFLKRYGYLEYEAPLQAGALDEKTVRALSRYKQRHGLPAMAKLDAPTRSLMALHRCGLPDLLDPLSFSTIGPWNRRKLTFAFGPLSSQLGATEVRSAVINAFKTWEAAGVGLMFKEVSPAANPDIQVEWRPVADPDHSMVGGNLAHADFPPGFSIIVSAPPLPIHYDDEETLWANGAVPDAYDIQTVALHEIGHCLGLLHSSVQDSVMYPVVSPEFTRWELQPDDLEGIRALYPYTTIRSHVATRNRDGRLEIFSIGADSAVWDLSQTGVNTESWSVLRSLGNSVKEIASVRNADGRLQIFAIGANNAVVHNRQTQAGVSTWSGWRNLVGAVKHIAAALNSDGRLEIFGIGMDNALLNNWQTQAGANAWSGWNRLGGSIRALCAIINTDGRLEVFGIGMDSALLNIWQTQPHAGPWSGWNRLGGGIKQIAADRNADGRLEVFAIGLDNAVWNIWQTRPHAGPWSGWNSLGGGVKQIVVAGNADGRLEIFAIGTDNAVWTKSQSGPSAGPWTPWNRLGGVVKQISAARNQDGRLEVFGIGSDDNLYHIWQTRPNIGPWSLWQRLT